MTREPVSAEPEMVFVPTSAPYIDPETESDESCPTLVILGWAAVASDPVSVEPEMVFVPTSAPYIDPETESDESCPTLVMLG